MARTVSSKHSLKQELSRERTVPSKHSLKQELSRARTVPSKSSLNQELSQARTLSSKNSLEQEQLTLVEMLQEQSHVVALACYTSLLASLSSLLDCSETCRCDSAAAC